jgi:small subunit ribosomal protein S1
VGSTVKGKITHITDFGLFVEVEEGIEGLVHISEASLERIKNLSEKFKVGDEIRAKVIKVDAEKKKLGLSIKRLLEEEERSVLYKYSSGQKGIMKLGELFKTKQNII